MSNNFLQAIKFTLPWETGKWKNGVPPEDGGYTNDPNDPGGETKWGISKRANPDLDIKNLTIDKALERYKLKYYDIYKENRNFRIDFVDLDLLSPALATAIFDTGVNCGVNRAWNWYQTAKKTKDPVKNLLGLRDAHYTNLKAGRPDLIKYYKGWINRLTDLKKYCEILNNDNAL